MTFHFLNDVANDAKSIKNVENYVIIAILKIETMGKPINRIPDSRHLISSLPVSALMMHVKPLGKPRDANKRSQSIAW